MPVPGVGIFGGCSPWRQKRSSAVLGLFDLKGFTLAVLTRRVSVLGLVTKRCVSLASPYLAFLGQNGNSFLRSLTLQLRRLEPGAQL